MKSLILSAALALCLPLSGLAQSVEKSSADAKAAEAKAGGDAKSSVEKNGASAPDAGLKTGHKMKPHAASSAGAPESGATVK